VVLPHVVLLHPTVKVTFSDVLVVKHLDQLPCSGVIFCTCLQCRQVTVTLARMGLPSLMLFQMQMADGLRQTQTGLAGAGAVHFTGPCIGARVH
jgi:hypothetical protein